MSYAWRTLLVLAAFLGVGYVVMQCVLAHSAESETPLPQIRLAAGMAGLFAGGAAACIVAIAVLWRRKMRDE